MRLFFWLFASEWRAHPARLCLGLGAIAAGVALGFCVHLVNGSAISHFGDAIHVVTGKADVEIVAREARGFDESVYPRIANLPEVAVASPEIEASVALRGDDSAPLHILGIDPFTARDINPSVTPRAQVSSDLGELQDDRAIWLHPLEIESLHKKVGDALEILVGTQKVSLRLAGALPSADTHLAVMDIAAAQWRLNQLGRLSRIAVRRAPAVSDDELTSALLPLVPANAQLMRPSDGETRADRLSRAYRVNLDMLALMALFTGALLIYSTQSLSVQRRRTQTALLRVLGLARRQVLWQILFEGALLGALGSVIGLTLGSFLASVLLKRFGGDLGGGYFSGHSLSLVFAPQAATVFFLLGVGASIAGSWLPASKAQRQTPAVALKGADGDIDPNRTPRSLAAPLLLIAALILLTLPAYDELPVAGYLAMACLLFAGIAVVPIVVRTTLNVILPLTRAGSLSRTLAILRLWAAPQEGVMALSGIVASASLMVAMAIMVSSFRHSVDAWVTALLPADLYLHIQGPSDSFFLDQSLQARLRALPDVQRVEFLTLLNMQLAADRPPVALLARDFNGDRPRGLPVLSEAKEPRETEKAADAQLPRVWISEAMQQLYGWQPAEHRTLPLSSQSGTPVSLEVTIAGVWRDYARQNGTVVIEGCDYERATGATGKSDAAFYLLGKASVSNVQAAILSTLPGTLKEHAQLAQPGQIRAASLVIFDRSFAITYVLEVVAIGIGLAGVAATFSAQTLARRREFGMLRHIGLRTGEVLRMIAWEGLWLGAFGVICGFALGFVQGEILIRIINPQSFHWTMETFIPWPLLSLIAFLILSSSAGMAMIAGRGAVSVGAVRAVREDW